MIGRLIIFEGPDGSGKTTAAKHVAGRLGASYVHMGAFPEVPAEGSLIRTYAEAMLPAMCGESNVVLDRCWISEVPYGEVFRNGADRVRADGRRVLSDIAARICRAQLIIALPPRDVVLENFLRRRGTEMLSDVTQLNLVYDWYDNRSARETTRWDYTTQRIGEIVDL